MQSAVSQAAKTNRPLTILTMTSPPRKSVSPVSLHAREWSVVVDDVMGGRSAATLSNTEEELHFEGVLSLENRGGFASCRRPLAIAPGAAKAVQIEYCGDGRPFQIRLRRDSQPDAVAWSANIASSGRWQSICVPLEEFHPVFRGRSVPEAGPVVASQITQLGLMIADGRAGSFLLRVKALGFVVDD